MRPCFRRAVEVLFAADAPFFDAPSSFDPAARTSEDVARSLIAAAPLALAGDESARGWLRGLREDPEWGGAAAFFLDVGAAAEGEADAACEDPAFVEALEALAAEPAGTDAIRRVFFPEALGLPEARAERVAALRERRRVRDLVPSERPLRDPLRELVFTSNVLLSVPLDSTDVDALDYADELKAGIRLAMEEPQAYWFDHPVPVGIPPANNEILYGLRGLNEAVAFEKARGNAEPAAKAKVLLSVSVTHRGLRAVAKEYVATEIRNAGGFAHLDVYVFGEDEARRVVEELLSPVLEEGETLPVFGVDGEYGRHYSFLKAIVAVWQTLVDPAVRATFKIDLDQVFPQRELVDQTGASAFEHFRSPLWGATGLDAAGRSVELGMIAGALVNEKDVGRGLFVPDVPFPETGPANREERLFFGKMLMALSTEGELGTRYGAETGIDGRTSCIQRIHVTGGTNGILVDALRRHRPFTPSFVGRAEDQCYILSVLLESGTKLAYLHEDGLIMRHDKEAFAAEAIRQAAAGNRVGDLIRTLYFSAYARVLSSGDLASVKRIVDPFTGCFVSRIPALVVLLRFVCQAADLLFAGDVAGAVSHLQNGAPRLRRALRFSVEELPAAFRSEREQWDRFYDALDRIEGSPERLESLRERAVAVVRAAKAD